MATFTEGEFVNSRGQKLYYRQWPALGGSPKAFLIFHHGYGSHCGAYDTEFKKIAEAGISVFLYDAHSFGRSEPKDPKLRSLVLDFRHLVDDVYTFREQVVDKAQPSPALPVFMSGLSMGGMTAILTALRDKSKWKGIICLSPAVDCPRTVTLRIMSAIQGLILLLAPNSRVVPQPQIPNITLNEQERKNLEVDEFFDPKKVRARMGSTFLQAWDYIAKHEQELALPILIHYSTIDKIVFPPATERLASNVKSEDVTVKPFDKFAHDLWLDTCKEDSSSLVIDWILARLGGQPSTPAGQAPFAAVSSAATAPKGDAAKL